MLDGRDNLLYLALSRWLSAADACAQRVVALAQAPRSGADFAPRVSVSLMSTPQKGVGCGGEARQVRAFFSLRQLAMPYARSFTSFTPDWRAQFAQQ